MTRRIMIVGGGRGRAVVIEKARAMGLELVVVDDHPGAPAGSIAVEDATNPAALVEAGHLQAVDAVLALEERVIEAAARAAHELGLPGVSPEVAFRVRNKLALRETLRAQGLPGPAFRGVHTIETAEAVARELGLPIIVRPADASSGRGTQRVDYIEDISLALVQALKWSTSGTVVLEALMEGAEYNVDGHVFDGEYRLGGITAKERSEPPYRYDIGMHMPAPLDETLRDAIVAEAIRGLHAIGFTGGTLRVDVMVTAEGLRISDIAIPVANGCVATDLVARAYGKDYLGDSLRIVLGDPPREEARFERGCALYWIPSRSGVVNEVLGVDEARARPGVEEVRISVQPGDVLGHVVDCVTRDRIGCVLASADTAAEAVRIAKAARDTVHVVTRPTYEKT